MFEEVFFKCKIEMNGRRFRGDDMIFEIGIRKSSIDELSEG